MVAEQPGDSGEGEGDALADEEDLDGMDADGSDAGDDMPDSGTMPPPVTEAAGQQSAA